MPKKATKNPIDQEKDAQAQAEAPTFDSTAAADLNDEQAEKADIVEAGAEAEEATPAELAAVSQASETAKAVNKKSTKKAVKEEPKAKKSGRSAKYKQSLDHVEKGRLYKLEEAIELIKKASYSKFDGSVEIHLRLTKKKSKGSTESSKGALHLPHGTGKEKKIILLDEAKIEAIAKTKKIDFDVALATPELMPKVAKIAKILGPKGKMPDPKSGTVTTDPKRAVDEINAGKIEYRIDSSNNIHQLVGKVSWDAAKLQENIQAVLSALPKSKIAAAYITASMSPSVTLDLTHLK